MPSAKRAAQTVHPDAAEYARIQTAANSKPWGHCIAHSMFALDGRAFHF
jgi:hypothetical protein